MNTTKTMPQHSTMLAEQCSPGQTVAGIQLRPGERVLYFWKPNRTADRAWTFVGGIVLLPLLIGIYLLYVGFTYADTSNHYWVITNQRIFTVNANARVRDEIGIHEITRLVHRRGDGKNSLIVHSSRAFISFRVQERHDIERLKPFLENLRNPAFLDRVPSVPFEA
jgi:hypothetical protein